MTTIYLVPWTVQKFAGDICWGSCGKGQVGAIGIDVWGGTIECIPCREAECPHVEREMEWPGADVDGDSVVMRKLKEPTE